MVPNDTLDKRITKICADTLRVLSIEMIQYAKSGHPGLPLGAADVAAVLWTRHLKHNPHNPIWPDRDRFVLSAGHGSALLYSLLHLSGYQITTNDLMNFRQWGSHTAGHPEYEPEIGIEITTGPLGQGIGNAVGMAMAERWKAENLNTMDHTIVDHYTYALAGDGCLMEGISHEAASLAGHLKLGKLIVFFDDNGITIDGSTSITCSDNALARFESYGWQTLAIDGHDYDAIDAAIKYAKVETSRPTLIACKTHIGFGSPVQDSSKAHGSPLGYDAIDKTKTALSWPYQESFYVPDETQAVFAQVRERGLKAESRWQKALEELSSASPELFHKWEMINEGKMPFSWKQSLPDFTGKEPIATRATSERVINAISPQICSLLGGSADLTGSNNTKAADATPITPDDFSGSYIYYGVREHAMGAIMNGLATHRIRAFGGTFLSFADYMRPAMRVAALMGLPVIYVFTHDSIGLGEDGPTHQPVEHLASLRIIPNLVTIRPADGNETSRAWQVALERKDGPTCLILSRQSLPQVTPYENDLSKGAYLLAEADNSKPDINILASGSEVSLALNTKKELVDIGIQARVISMPSWELFDTQDQDYKDTLFLSGVPCLSIEAGSTFGWDKYLGNTSDKIGIDRFGASAPGPEMFRNYGFSVENAVKKVRELLH